MAFEISFVKDFGQVGKLLIQSEDLDDVMIEVKKLLLKHNIIKIKNLEKK